MERFYLVSVKNMEDEAVIFPLDIYTALSVPIARRNKKGVTIGVIEVTELAGTAKTLGKVAKFMGCEGVMPQDVRG